jgi:TetR/AcrR family transcriptional regulator, transcriptional repressor for nem operon
MRNVGRETRRNVIEKSLQIFSVKGYHNASISDIMAATELTKGGLYAHFDSKEALWNAAYDRAVEIWRGIVFKGVRNVSDPLDRVAKTIGNDLRDYCCGEVFEGGCFFFNSLVELSGQSPAMSGRIVDGFMRFSDLLAFWLEEAKSEGKLKPGVRIREVADFIVISINGAAALYAATRSNRFPRAAERQLNAYLRSLRA